MDYQSKIDAIWQQWDEIQAGWNKLDQEDKNEIKEVFNAITAASPLFFKGFGDFIFEGEKDQVQERFRWMTKDERDNCLELMVDIKLISFEDQTCFADEMSE